MSNLAHLPFKHRKHRFALTANLTALCMLACIPAFAGDEEILGRIKSAYAENDISQVIELGKRLKENSPASASAHYLVGECLLKRQNIEEARKHFEMCRAMQPRSTAATYAS